MGIAVETINIFKNHLHCIVSQQYYQLNQLNQIFYKKNYFITLMLCVHQN